MHFPLECVISLCDQTKEPIQNIDLADHVCQSCIKYSWDELKSDSFMAKFRENLNTQYDRIMIIVNENIDEANNMILQLFYSATAHMRVGKKNLLNTSPPSNKPWWDAVCESMRNRKMQALRLLRTVSNRSNLSRYLTLRNTFKGVCRNKKQTYENEQKKKLVDSRKNPSKFYFL